MQFNYHYTMLDQIHDHNVAKKQSKSRPQRKKLTRGIIKPLSIDNQVYQRPQPLITLHNTCSFVYTYTFTQITKCILLHSVFYSNIHTMLSHIDKSKTRDDGGDIVTTQVQSTSINTGKDALCDQKQTHPIVPDLQYCV
jgi:hypothetical protein